MQDEHQISRDNIARQIWLKCYGLHGPDYPGLNDEKVQQMCSETFQKWNFNSFYTAYCDMHTKNFKRALSMGLYDNFPDVKRMRAEGLPCVMPYMWVTVNPTKDVSWQQLKKLVDKHCRKHWVTHYFYVIEQNGHDENDMGWKCHAHIVFKHTNLERLRFKTNMDSCFGSIVDRVDGKVGRSQLKIVPLMDCVEAEKKAKYCRGLKSFKNNDKKTMIKIDTIWRKTNGIAPFYHSKNAALWGHEDIDLKSSQESSDSDGALSD